MSRLIRYLYLNTYGFLLLAAGLLIISLPFWLISPFTLILQCAASFIPFYLSFTLLSSWNHKKREYALLMAKNKKEFKPETFQIYMEAPCGRKLTHVVLKDLGKSEEYKNLLIYKPSFIQSVKRCFEKPTFKVTYIDKELISKINNGKSAAQQSL